MQERADSLDGLLYMASNVTGLEAMPNRASGDGAAPVEDQVTKKGKFLPVATRFGLDGTRVRDLLAGEQLYTDRSLAIRELYQNALDACNVRQARELWNPGLATDNSWQGKIEIRQQMYGSRQVVECIDNGSGMGRGELLHAFAQGGVRLSHLSEFQEEKLQWRKKRIPFHENSRFGIGVLSYFMIADEIEVITRKFHRDRHAGTILKVVISGPDHLFHVEEEVYDAQFGGDECGTILRCYLRSDLVDFSSVQALRSVLGVAQFKTVAKHGVECETWEPGIYRRRVNVHGVNPIDGSGDIVRDPEGEVFWCEYDGSLLIDGIHAESIWINPEGKPIESRGNGTMRVPGAVVNLVGPVVVAEGREKSTPRLTVDRSKVIDDVFVPILKRLRAATASLSDAGFLDYRWLGRATRREPRLADVIVQGLIDQNASLSYDDGSVSMAQIGYMPGDEVFRTFWRHPSPHAKIKPTRIEGGSLPDHIALWRYMAHFREEVASALGELLPSDWQNRNLRPALPSDSVVLGLAMDSDGGIRGHTVTTLEKLPQYAAKLHEELPTTIGRLQELNLQMAGSFELLDMQTITSYTSSLSSGLMGSAFGLVAVMKDRRVHAGWFMRVCDEMQTSTSKLGEYLRHIGYDLQYCSRLLDPDAPGHGEAISLISERFDGRSPWYAAEKLSSSRVLQAAARLNMSVEAVRTAYARLGILPPQFERNRGSDLDGLLLLGLGSRASEKSCALIPDVLRACLVTGEEPASVVQRAAALGIAVDGEPPEKLPTYASLLQVPVSDRDPVDAHRPISLPEIKAIHERTGMAMQLIADQLRELGVCVPFREIPNRLDSEDERLLAQGVRSYGMRVWLDPARVVPRAHVLLAAASLRKSPDEIVQRLLGLGMQVDPLPSDLPYSGIERRAIDSWIPYDGPRIVPLGCVLQVAIDSKCTVPEAVAILRAYGLTVQDIPAGMVEVSSEDHLLFTSVRPERISFSRRLSTVEVVARARATDVTVEIVRRRLLELGAKIPSARDFRRHAYGDDDLFRGFPAELDPIPAAYVLLKADGMGLALIEIIDRLVAAGVSIQEFDFGPIERPGWEDLTMLRNNGSPSGAEISLVRPVSLEHLLICAHRMNLTVGDVAERLGQLGLKVGDVGKMIDDAWKMVPKIP
ncbi:hypothetical protein [Streptomyces sp. NPDC101455]|uniref:wHTH domain-containing protein n=1 Tax=Streptomyces sp. NPDC101455 TaxID=3366142 RepID=UPI0037F2E4FB